MYWEIKPFRLNEDCLTTWQRTSSSRGSVEPARLGSVIFSEACNVSARGIFFFRDGRIGPNTKTEVALTPSEISLADRVRVRFAAGTQSLNGQPGGTCRGRQWDRCPGLCGLKAEC